MDGYKITDLKNADSSSDPSDAVSKKYVDDQLATKLDMILQTDFNMSNRDIINLA